jgi:hypothetical protein
MKATLLMMAFFLVIILFFIRPLLFIRSKILFTLHDTVAIYIVVKLRKTGTSYPWLRLAIFNIIAVVPEYLCPLISIGTDSLPLSETVNPLEAASMEPYSLYTFFSMCSWVCHLPSVFALRSRGSINRVSEVCCPLCSLSGRTEVWL